MYSSCVVPGGAAHLRRHGHKVQPPKRSMVLSKHGSPPCVHHLILYNPVTLHVKTHVAAAEGHECKPSLSQEQHSSRAHYLAEVKPNM